MGTDALSLREHLQLALGSGYTLERELGGGGMARVFLAQDATLGRRIVVKVLSPEFTEGVSSERFAREIRLAASLQEPRIVPVLAAGATADGLPYYTMPFVDGESLRARLAHEQAAGRPLRIEEAVSILRDVAIALEYAHAHGVVHRDVKPDNVLLSGRTAVVTDFGIARAIAASTHAPSATAVPGGSVGITRVGATIGTPAYMAPEQAAGDGVGAQADIYAWGVVAYEMLAGAHPFADRTTGQQLMAAHIAEAPAPLASKRDDVPPALTALVMQCLEKDPARRPAGAAALVVALSSIVTRGATPAARRRAALRRTAWVGAALLAVAAAGAVIFRGRPGAAGADSRTVAVAPFENLGATADEYFADGVTEEIANRLARVPGLSVVGRGSALRSRGSGKSPEEIGLALGAEYVLRGSVRWARGADGDTAVRITPALVRVSSGAEVWSADPYQATLTDVFRVQAEVAEHVATALQMRLGDARRAAVDNDDDQLSPAALDGYLLGRHYWRKRGLENLRRAVSEYRRAIAADSGFAPAWAGYADAYALLPQFGDTGLAPADVRREAERAARRAIAIDDADARGHAALGVVLQFDYAFRDALVAFDRAAALDSSDAAVHQRRAEVLLALGRLPEAEAAGGRAVALDPLSGIANHAMALVLFARRRSADAIRFSRRAVELEPDVPLFGQALTSLYAVMGRLAEADSIGRRGGWTSDAMRTMQRAWIDPARRAEGRAALTAWRAVVPDRVPGHGFIAYFYAGLGPPDSAFAVLRRGIDARDSGIPLTLEFAHYDAIRGDPRWPEIVRQVRGR